MDIVSRLKIFISHLGVPVTQFADICKIPRPTLSQLLNGRNKKVSDEVLRKLHSQYPMLNISWLLFGEGDMLNGKNIETSELNQQALIDFSDIHSSKTELVDSSIKFETAYIDSDSENENQRDDALGAQVANKYERSGEVSQSASSVSANSKVEASRVQLTPSMMEIGTDVGRKIVNIIVYYSDNSFESFIPGTPSKT